MVFIAARQDQSGGRDSMAGFGSFGEYLKAVKSPEEIGENIDGKIVKAIRADFVIPSADIWEVQIFYA